MLTDVVIEDYQALAGAHLRLGRFTVVTGPTGSGKSAVIRAIKLVAFNAPGTAFVRTGAKDKTCRVCLAEESWQVGIERGGRGKDSYRIATGPGLQDFTKLNKQVPAEVSALLKLDDINFAGQFDRPFLLAESGGTVARVLGELTNVTLVFDAAREANRRKLEISRELKMWQQSLTALTEQAQQYRTLKARLEAKTGAEERLKAARYIEGRLAELHKVMAGWVKAERAEYERQMELDDTVPPGTAELDRLLGQLAAVRTLYAQHCEAARAEGQWADAADAAARSEEQAHQALHAALVAAGTCPTCGSEIRD